MHCPGADSRLPPVLFLCGAAGKGPGRNFVFVSYRRACSYPLWTPFFEVYLNLVERGRVKIDRCTSSLRWMLVSAPYNESIYLLISSTSSGEARNSISATTQILSPNNISVPQVESLWVLPVDAVPVCFSLEVYSFGLVRLHQCGLVVAKPLSSVQHKQYDDTDPTSPDPSTGPPAQASESHHPSPNSWATTRPVVSLVKPSIVTINSYPDPTTALYLPVSFLRVTCDMNVPHLGHTPLSRRTRPNGQTTSFLRPLSQLPVTVTAKNPFS